VTLVPSGYREFCYIVDGVITVSSKHPTNPNGSCNWRTVYGPPMDQVKRDNTANYTPSRLQWFMEFSEAVAESIGHLVPVPGQGAAPRQKKHEFDIRVGVDGDGHAPGRAVKESKIRRVGDTDVESSAKWLDQGGHLGKGRRTTWIDKPLRVLLSGIALYAFFALGYVGWQHVQ
jgi:hypothetical protein